MISPSEFVASSSEAILSGIFWLLFLLSSIVSVANAAVSVVAANATLVVATLSLIPTNSFESLSYFFNNLKID